VLPGRAKGTRYFGDTAWHRDNPDRHAPPAVVFVIYLDPLDTTSGALRVLAGSHTDHDMSLPSTFADTRQPETLGTVPGDVVAFHERLIHGSSGGGLRRQWRVDFVIDPRDADEDASVQAQYVNAIGAAQLEDANTRYPSYGPYWQARDRPWTNRLRDLGVYQSATARRDT
jgi:Phytanoyl-CoA dioxygenase (PhyH)